MKIAIKLLGYLLLIAYYLIQFFLISIGWDEFFLQFLRENTTGIIHRLFYTSGATAFGVLFAFFSIYFHGFLLAGTHMKLLKNS